MPRAGAKRCSSSQRPKRQASESVRPTQRRVAGDLGKEGPGGCMNAVTPRLPPTSTRPRLGRCQSFRRLPRWLFETREPVSRSCHARPQNRRERAGAASRNGAGSGSTGDPTGGRCPLCKPEVTGSIPVRSIKKGPARRGFSFSSRAPWMTQIGLWSTGWSTGALPNPIEASDFRTFSRSSASLNGRA
jgi:hypothetical protein